MKLRIIKEDDEFIPQYFDDEGKFPCWRECRADNYLDARYYHTEKDAMKVIEEFKKRHPKPNVVWEEDY